MKNAAVKTALLLSCFAAFSQTADLQPLATVKLTKNEVITVKQLKGRVAMYEKQNGSPISVDERRQVLDSLINEKLVVQAAQKAGISVTDSEVNEQFSQFISQMAGRRVTEQEYAAMVKQQTGKSFENYFLEQMGLSIAAYKGFLKNQMLAQRYIGAEKQGDLYKIQPTDEEIRNYYALNESILVRPTTLKLFLVAAPKGTDSAGARKKVDAIRDELKTKKNYDEVARRNQPGVNAGDIYVARTMQDAEQLRININALLNMFKQDTGYVSDVIDTGNDFQFYVVREKLGAKMLTLDDLAQPGTTTTVYQYILNIVAQQKQMQFLAAASKEVAEKLRTSQNFTMNKSGDALTSLLSW
ncbi:MAG: SurA N-terminal domain-containing protein [Spirochaetaceae bacterium]|jgi:hypothetical protein|nr:SurA N-terminal domain-containing protein [Spirochaetaceae bacterium]